MSLSNNLIDKNKATEKVTKILKKRHELINNNLKTIYNCFQEFTIEITNLLKEENEKISEELEKHENEMENIKNKYEKVKNSYFNISKGIEKLFSEEENVEGSVEE